MVTASLYLLQEKLLFRPTVLDKDYKFAFNCEFKELFFNTEHNVSINAIHFKTKNPKGVILYFHGNKGDLSRWGNIASYFVTYNYDVLVIDYRTYGKSKGKLSENALYHDAQWCYNYLKKQYSEDHIIVYGRSLGTGIASYVASKNTPKHLILETPYYNIPDVAKHRFPFLPIKYLAKYEFPNYKHLQSTSCSVAMFHGTKDDVIPLESAQKLYDHHSNKVNISFTIIQDAEHNNIDQFEAYHILIKSILQ